MQPVTSGQNNIQSIINRYPKIHPTIIQFLITFSQKEITDDDIHQLEDLKKRILALQINNDTSQSISGIENICLAVLFTNNIKNQPKSYSSLSTFYHECQGHRLFPIITDLNIGEVFKQGVASNNPSLINRASTFLFNKTGIELKHDIKSPTTLDFTCLLDEAKINLFKIIYPQIIPLLTKGCHLTYTSSAPSDIMKLIAPYLLKVHIKESTKDYVPINLTNLDELLQNAPKLEKIVLDNVFLDEESGLINYLLTVAVPIEILHPRYNAQEIHENSIATLLEAGIQGKSILLSRGVQNFFLLDQEFIDEHLESCFHYYLRARTLCSQYDLLDDEQAIPDSLLNDETQERLLTYCIDHMTDSTILNNDDAFSDSFKSELKISFERFPQIAGPVTPENLELKIANARFFKNQKEYQQCLIACFTSAGCHLVLDSEQNDIFETPVTLIFDSPADLIIFRSVYDRFKKYFTNKFELTCVDEGDKLAELCHFIGDRLSTLSLSTKNLLNQKQLSSIVKCCPNLVKIIFDHFHFEKEHEEPLSSKLIQIQYHGIENTQYKINFENFQKRFLLKHLTQLSKTNCTQAPNWLINNLTVFQVLELNYIDPMVRSFAINHCIKFLSKKYTNSEIANENLLEFSKLYVFLRNKLSFFNKKQLDQLSALFGLLDDISLIIPTEDNVGLTAATLHALDLPLPYHLVNSENIVQLIDCHLRFSLSLQDVCFRYFREKFNIELGYDNDILEIVILKECEIESSLNYVLKLAEKYSFLTFASESMIPQNVFAQLKTILPKVHSLRITPELINGSLFISDVLSACKVLRSLVMEKLTLSLEDFAACATHENLNELIIHNCTTVDELPAIQNPSITRISFNNLPIRTLPQFDSKNLMKVSLSHLNLDDLSSLTTLLNTQKIRLDHVTLSESAKMQLLQMIYEGKTLVLSHVNIDENFLQTLLSKISEEEYKKQFSSIYEMFKDNATKKMLLIHNLSKDDKERSFFFDYQEEILRLFPPTSPENVARYPIICSNQRHLKLELWLPALMPYYHPYKVLRAISLNFEKFHSMTIKHYENTGEDHTGLSRQFLTLLFQGLIEFPSEQIRVTKKSKGYLLCEGHRVSDEDYRDMKTIGKLMALAAFSEGRYTIGEVFSDTFFSAVLKLSQDELVGPLNLNRSLELYELLLSKEELKEVETYKEIKTLKNLSELTSHHKDYLICMAIELESIEQIHKELDEYFQPLCNKYLNIIRAIACGIEEALPLERCTQWSQFTQIESSRFAQLVQGTFDIAHLKKLIKIFELDDGDRDLTAEELKNPVVTQNTLNNWIIEWLDQHNEDEIRNVLQAITGSRSLSRKITFNLSNQIPDLFAQTCSMAVDVPNRISKEAFFERLNHWGKGTDINIFTQH